MILLNVLELCHRVPVNGYYYSASAGNTIVGFIDTDTDPASGGLIMDSSEAAGGSEILCVSFAVKSGEYFEIEATGAPTIYWRSVGTLSKPVDQD